MFLAHKFVGGQGAEVNKHSKIPLFSGAKMKKKLNSPKTLFHVKPLAVKKAAKMAQ